MFHCYVPILFLRKIDLQLMVTVFMNETSVGMFYDLVIDDNKVKYY